MRPTLATWKAFSKRKRGYGDHFSLPEKRITQGGETTPKSLDDILPSTSEASLYSLKNRRQKIKNLVQFKMSFLDRSFYLCPLCDGDNSKVDKSLWIVSLVRFLSV